MRLSRWLLVGALVVVLLAIAPVSSPRAPAEAAVDNRPNIVVVMMDDMRWDEMRFAPNARRYIASRGVTFANSFSPLPLCCPARASFLLGQYAHNHRVLHVKAPYGFGSVDDSRTVATSLHGAGYNTAMVGKYLNGYGRMRSRVTHGSSVHYKPAGWTDWAGSLEASWPRGSRFRGGTYNYLSFTQNINRRVVAHRGQYSSDVIGTQAVNLVGKYHRSRKPFFLWLTPVAPHSGGPFEKGRDPHDYRKRNGYVQEFPTPYTPAWVRGKLNRYVTHAPGTPLHHRAEPNISDKPYYYRKYLENTSSERGRLREVERQRAEAIYAWDRQFGKLVAKLRSTGEYGRTVLMFTSDNGFYLGEHRHPAGKLEPHEVSVRVPLVVAGPRVKRGVRFAPAMTQDLTSTIIDIANGRSLRAMDGQSLWPQMTGADKPWTRPVIIEALIRGMRRTSKGFPPRITEFGIRTGRYKYVRYSQGTEELYDLARDPNELTGRQRDPAYAAIKRQLVVQWKRYAGCRAAACNAALPTALQQGTATLRSQNSFAWAAKTRYYDR